MRCETKHLSYVLAGLLLCGGGLAKAHPLTAPLWGPSGLGVMPTTDTVPEGKLEAALGYERVEPLGQRVRFSPVISVGYGTQRGELGGGWLHEDLTVGGFNLKTDYNVLHAKYRFWGEDPNRSCLAVGWHYLEFHRLSGHVNSFYLTGSRRMWGKPEGGLFLRGHAGVLYNRTTTAGTTNDVRPMVGADLRLFKGMVVGADYIAPHGTTARLRSVVARYDITPDLTIQAGVGRLASDDDKKFASIAYRFSTGSDKSD